MPTTATRWSSTSCREAAQRLINASADLYARVKRLDEGQLIDEPAPSPARALMGRLERDLIWNRTADPH